MKGRDLFGVVVRTLALLLSLLSLWWLAYGLAEALGAPEQTRGEMSAYVIGGLVLGAISIGMLRGAAAIVGFSYPEDDGHSHSPGPPDGTQHS